MPRAQLIRAATGEILDDLGFFETAAQARSACARHADQMLIWALSPDGFWIAEDEDEGVVYHVEADLLEE